MSGGPGHVVILGLMGVGKTTVGELLARQLGRPHRDSDGDIEARTGRTGREIAATDGVDALHQLEIDVLLEALAADEPTVISAAGYVVESALCREAIAERGIGVWLDLPVADMLTRMGSGHHRRDVTEAEVAAQVAEREPLFRDVAGIVADARPAPDRIVAQILAGLGPSGIV